MAEGSFSMFSDRRDSHRDRRKNELPIPANLDRRVNSRRNGQFHAREWWLRVDYADEFVSEKEFAKELKLLKPGRNSVLQQKPLSPPEGQEARRSKG